MARIVVGFVIAVLLLNFAIEVDLSGAAANMLADLVVVGAVTVGARSWLIQLRRKAFAFEITQLHKDAKRHVDAWIRAHQTKQSQYAHLVGASVDNDPSTDSYRKSREAARWAVIGLDRHTGRDDLRQAVHNVGVAEQAAKARRMRMFDLLDPVFAGWLDGQVTETDVAKYQGNLPSQVGIAGRDDADIKAQEAKLVAPNAARVVIEGFLEKERFVGTRLAELSELVHQQFDAPTIAADRVPDVLPKFLRRVGLICAVSACAIWGMEALTRWVLTGNPGAFSGDVLNNLLCALAVAAAGISFGAYAHNVARAQQAREAARPVADLCDALANATTILDGIADHDSERYLVSVETGCALSDEMSRIRLTLEDLQGIRPDQQLGRLEDQLSDLVMRFTSDVEAEYAEEHQITSAKFLIDDLRKQLVRLFPEPLGQAGWPVRSGLPARPSATESER